MNTFKFQYYLPILQNINNLYQSNQSPTSWWTCADKEFLHDLSKCPSMPYHHVVQRYIHFVIQNRLASNTTDSRVFASGKVLALSIDDQLDDGMAEGATQGFFDACDTPPPEFWVAFEHGILYSFIPTEFIYLADEGIISSIGKSLEWVSDLIYFQNIQSVRKITND